jgi:hypothetical protein
MRREDLEKLLGGYAAGTLTEAERRALFEAAVSDQELFEKLAEEEPLRDTLADPQSRARVLAALGWQQPVSVWRRFGAWALAASAAAAVVVVGAIVLHKPQPPIQQVAMLRKSVPAAPQIAPAPANEVAAPLAKTKPAPKRRKIEAVVPPPAPAGAPAPMPEAREAARPRLILSAQAGGVLPARDLFYRANIPVAPQAAEAQVVLRQSSAARMERRALDVDASRSTPVDLGLRYSLMRRGLDGRYFELPPDAPLDPGEPARLRVEPNDAGYLYVLGDGALIYNGHLGAHEPTMIDARPGALSIILTRQPDPGPVDSILERARQQFAAAEFRMDKPAQLHPRDEAIYVVNTSPAPDARVLLEIQLTYK